MGIVYERNIGQLITVLNDVAKNKVGQKNDPQDMFLKKYKKEIYNRAETLLRQMASSIYIQVKEINISQNTDKRSCFTYQFRPFHNAAH